MALSIRHRDGGFEVRYRRRTGGPFHRLARQGAALAGLLLLAAPAAVAGPAGWVPLLGLGFVEAVLVATALKLLAEASRRERIFTVLDLGTGQLEIRAGRRPLALRRRFGAVEADRVRLTRFSEGPRQRFRVALVAHLGPPVVLIDEEADEVACREAALLVSRGMGVPLEDRRYPGPESLKEVPARVATLEQGRRRVLSWDYRDRFRPRGALLLMGLVVAVSTLLPSFVRDLGLALVFPAGLAVVLGLGLGAHVTSSLTRRRLTLDVGSIRVERVFLGMRLTRSEVPHEAVAAVLVFRRGPVANVHLRLSRRRWGPVLPFEDPAMAGWLRFTIERAVHDGVREIPARPRRVSS